MSKYIDRSAVNQYGRTFKTRQGAINLARREKDYAAKFDAVLIPLQVGDTAFVVDWVNADRSA